MKHPILEASGLCLAYESPEGTQTQIGPLDFTLHEGESLGLIGESGAGKSTVGYEILGLLRYKGGRRVGGHLDFRGISHEDAAFIPQDPLSALDPLFSIGSQMRELGASGAKIEEVLRKVRLPLEKMSLKSYPHELSGGMRQRLVIAMALLRSPKLLIADEPTSSLDPLLQYQMMELFRELHREGMTFIFVTHQLALAASFCERLIVMHRGKVAEQGTPDQIFRSPRHPVTQQLVQSVPVMKV